MQLFLLINEFIEVNHWFLKSWTEILHPNNEIKKLVKYAADQFAFRETRICWPINESRKIHLHIFKHSQIIKNSNFSYSNQQLLPPPFFLSSLIHRASKQQIPNFRLQFHITTIKFTMLLTNHAFSMLKPCLKEKHATNRISDAREVAENLISKIIKN